MNTKSLQLIVSQLKHLLESLKGSPVGLKLNIELNNFFLGIFGYHVNLWILFLSEYLDGQDLTMIQLHRIIRLFNNSSDDTYSLCFFSISLQ